MKNALRRAGTGLAAMALMFSAANAHAQTSSDTISCVTDALPDNAPELLVNDLLATRGIGEAPPPEFMEEFTRTLGLCSYADAPRPEADEAYRIFALTSLVVPEIRSRLASVGLDMGPIDEMLEAAIAAGSTDFDRDQIATFSDHIEAFTDASGENHDEVFFLSVSVVEFSFMQQEALSTLEARSRSE